MGRKHRLCSPCSQIPVPRDRREKKLERPEEGIFKSGKNQVESVAKCSINLQKFNPDGPKEQQ